MFTDQPYIANSILLSDENQLLVSKTEMNEWLSAHGIGKPVPTVSGGTVVLGSSRGGENK